MAHKRHEVNGAESKTGYTGKYFRYDQLITEKNQMPEEQEEKSIKRERPKAKKKKK